MKKILLLFLFIGLFFTSCDETIVSDVDEVREELANFEVDPFTGMHKAQTSKKYVSMSDPINGSWDGGLEVFNYTTAPDWVYKLYYTGNIDNDTYTSGSKSIRNDAYYSAGDLMGVRIRLTPPESLPSNWNISGYYKTDLNADPNKDLDLFFWVYLQAKEGVESFEIMPGHMAEDRYFIVINREIADDTDWTPFNVNMTPYIDSILDASVPTWDDIYAIYLHIGPIDPSTGVTSTYLHQDDHFWYDNLALENSINAPVIYVSQDITLPSSALPTYVGASAPYGYEDYEWSCSTATIISGAGTNAPLFMHSTNGLQTVKCRVKDGGYWSNWASASFTINVF